MDDRDPARERPSRVKILLTHRYFWPDTPPYASILHSIGARLAEAGHDVEVFSTMPSYRDAAHAPRRERDAGMDITRMRSFVEKSGGPLKRAANAGLYCCGLFVHVLRTKPQVVMASTFPPVIAAWTASLAARLVGARFVYHMQDVHPEVSFYSGGALGRWPFLQVLRAMDNASLRRASAIVVLSQDMAGTLALRGLGDLPVHVINNFALETHDQVGAVPEDLKKAPGRRRAIFAGNLGRFQNLPLLAEGIARCFEARPDLELMFLGDGAAEPELRRLWGDHPQVRFAPFLPYAAARELIADADIGLVSLNRDIYRVSYPSKLATYLGLGVPVLVLVEPDSDLANSVASEGLGAIPTAPTPEAISVALDRLLSQDTHATAIAEWQQANGRKSLLDRWRSLMSGLGA
ncbi:glycosyltransferase family 4 protein [Palleronia sp.]|uniref:glycosyltransferase family 4 protein n=1 Tax=Palleronia sp. TaxID=1940284 RepID=UPI0035C84AA2